MHIKQVKISGFRSFRSQSEIEPFRYAPRAPPAPRRASPRRAAPRRPLTRARLPPPAPRTM